MPHNFCVMTTGRSGSDLLFLALQQHPDIIIDRKCEILSANHVNVSNSSKLAREIVAGMKYDDGIPIEVVQNTQFISECFKYQTGVKLLYHQFIQTNLINTLPKENYKFIILTRNNKFDLYYSIEHARLTNIYHTTTPIEQKSLLIDTDNLINYINYQLYYEELVRQKFSSNYLEIVYEDLIENWDYNIQNILKYIDAEPIKLEKSLTKTITEKKIENLQEVKECLKNHYMHRYLSSF